MNEPAIRIFVDADACPVKEEVWSRTGLGSRAMIEAFTSLSRHAVDSDSSRAAIE
jgi:uncharacterized protein YaiI (UPF0178 family)